jgi:cysteinyl-tRNA synthetase
MALQVYNYLTRQEEAFEPLEPGKVRMYVCGPTVYDHAHIGHAKLYVAMDVVVRYLRFLDYDVRYVQNITDVGHLLDTGEDRMMKGARRDQAAPMEIAETYTRSYFRDMDGLKVTRPDISPRASGHIPEQIELTKILLEKGIAYEVDGNVYFSVEKFPEYGKLSGRKVEDLEPGARVAVREEKRHPADFALWKKAEPEHILRWPSPWGPGYPGWHAECTAMATKYLGETIDIHGGGLENMFPHNECEIAQAEAANDQLFARYWLLVGSLTVNGVKMSKSLGNFITISDALEAYSPEAIRTLVLSAHYRGPLDYSEEAMKAAQSGAQRLRNTVRAVQSRMKGQDEEAEPAGEIASALATHRETFEAAMNDDFNTPRAIAALHDMARDVNRWLEADKLDQGSLQAIDTTFGELGGDVLGIIPEELGPSGVDSQVLEGLVEIVLDIRQQYRQNKEWEQADQLRERLAEIGVQVEDRPEGATWRLER